MLVEGVLWHVSQNIPEGFALRGYFAAELLCLDADHSGSDCSGSDCSGTYRSGDHPGMDTRARVQARAVRS